MKPANERCCQEVQSNGIPGFQQCSNGGVVTRKGRLYCNTHDPIRVKMKRKKQDEKYDREAKEENDKWERRRLERLFCKRYSNTQLRVLIKTKPLRNPFPSKAGIV